MARNRIIYASQSVWVNGHVLYRVQSLGSTTTFTSEDIFELGHLDIIDIVDDVPAVAITLNTNDFGDVKTMAILAQVPDVKLAMDATADNTLGNLAVVSGTGNTEVSYLHGASLPDYAVTCGNLPGVTLWAPVQDECSLGTLADNIDQTLFMDEVYVNSLEFSYTTGANATENYGAETDNKMWLMNDGKFVSYEVPGQGTDGALDGNDITSEYVTLDLLNATGSNDVTVLSTGVGFLRKDADGNPAVTVWDSTLETMINYPVHEGNVGDIKDGWFTYDRTPTDNNQLFFPLNYVALGLTAGDKIICVYASTAYAPAMNSYFDSLETVNRPDNIGAIRQGQIEIYLVANDESSYDHAWRLTGCTISADLTREALAELGHLSPYDRPVTLPIPITVTIDSTAGDLENWAKIADLLAEFDAATLDDIDLADMMAYENLKLVVKIYSQTDEEASGAGYNRTVAIGSDLIGKNWFVDGELNGNTTAQASPVSHSAQTGVYEAGDYEYPMKTIVVEHLKITDEAYTLDLGSNATQTFGFRSTNDLYAIKGDVTIGNITGVRKIRRNG